MHIPDVASHIPLYGTTRWSMAVASGHTGSIHDA